MEGGGCDSRQGSNKSQGYLRLQESGALLGRLGSLKKPVLQFWQCRPSVWWRQSSHTPPLRRPEASHSPRLKWQLSAWPLHLHSELNHNDTSNSNDSNNVKTCTLEASPYVHLKQSLPLFCFNTLFSVSRVTDHFTRLKSTLPMSRHVRCSVPLCRRLNLLPHHSLWHLCGVPTMPLAACQGWSL